MAYHTRSNSFPSSQHPFTSQLDEHFSRLNAQQTSTSSSSICNQLSCLQDLHDCVDKCLLLPLTQQSLSQQENPFDQVLDGSLRFLDVCNMAKDALLETKECVHQLHSMARRKRGGELRGEMKEYFTCRKMVKKIIHKAFNNLKVTEIKDQQNIPIICLLKEVQGVTINILESVLSLINGSKTQAKLSGWSLVSKLVHHKRVRKEDYKDSNEFDRLDASLQSPKINVEDLQNQLKDVELCIQDLEDGIEGLYRRLIKTRVSLLNTLVQ